jgi:beta-galactosidase/beta-glucuronidase
MTIPKIALTMLRNLALFIGCLLMNGQAGAAPGENGAGRAPAKRSVESVIVQLGVVPRPEHPRPDRRRDEWHNLNGVWEFAFDPDDVGLAQNWIAKTALERQIVVPFAPESELSGINDENFHVVSWYARNFDVPEPLRNQRLLLHFGAVDYRAEVWLNGKRLGSHEGGYDPFCFDVTDIVKGRGNRLVVRAQDDPAEKKPQGKQSPERNPSGCLYMRVSGIWQTVWLEAVGSTYVRDWVVRADPATGMVNLQVNIDGPGKDLAVEVTVAGTGEPAVVAKAAVGAGNQAVLSLHVDSPAAWTPETPNLYDLRLRLLGKKSKEIDVAHSYFGFRRIEARDGQYFLNGKPFFMISALDQVYNPAGLYTAPTDDFLREDVLWAKRYGLNHVRKHQIVAEPRPLYWCDKLGLTVWGEMADWQIDITNQKSNANFLGQWQRCVERDINHPAIITWVPMNEQKMIADPVANAFKVQVYEATRRQDPTRPVIDTSGYCHTKTDICDLHVNPPDGKASRDLWKDWRRSIAATGNFAGYQATYCDGFRHQGQPVVISETGNWWIKSMPPQGPWPAYGAGPFADVAGFLAGYRDLFTALMEEPDCAGFSYVQLFDVEGEVNGYLTYDRKPKMAPEAIQAIHAEGLCRRARALEERRQAKPAPKE